SAPAASGPAQARPFLTDAALAGKIQVFERPQALSIPRFAGTAKLDGALARLTRGSSGRAVSSGVRASGLARTPDGRVRVVIDARRPSAAREAVLRSGGRVERSWHVLVQAVVDPSSLVALSRQPSISRVRAPARPIPQSVNGEEVALDLAPAWHAKGFTGK